MAVLVLPVDWREAAAQTPISRDTPVLFTADELVYDEKKAIVTARGNVELSQGDRILIADTITYNQQDNTVTASGNISLLEPTGEVLFSDYAVLDADLKNGFIDNLRALLTDGSRFAANRARRVGGARKEMDKAVFSPCNLCKEDPSRPPLWQIKAVRVVHDEAAKNIEYEDATFELFGLPVAYTPFLTHPDPTVKRRSGLLAPTLGFSGDLGAIYGQPYYYVVDDQSDVEVEPIVYAKEGLALRSQYRRRFTRGQIELATTAAYVEQRDEGEVERGENGLEGSADLEGRFALTDTWRAGFDFEQSSDRTYLRRYRLGDKEVLTSQLFAEGFRHRNYAAVHAYKFQGLRAGDDRSRSPIVTPFAQYSFVGEPSAGGGRFKFDANTMMLTRQTGTDSTRLSVKAGWEIPYYAPSGEIYSFAASLQGDLYSVSNPTGSTDPTLADEEDVTGRVFPQVALGWRYPLARRGSNYTKLIEPIVQIVGAPNGSNPDEIPNEDSQAFEFDDTTLFRLNRFEGYDRVTSGSRLDYGVRVGIFGDGGGASSFLIGQSYRFVGDGPFPNGSGLSEDVSDLVGRLRISPFPWLDLLYRFRIDADDLDARRNEVGFRFDRGRLGLSADYALLDEQETAQSFGDREQLDFNARFRLSENWSVTGNLVQDLSGDSNETLSAKTGLLYQDECILFGLDFERRNLEDSGLEPEDRIFLRVVLKHLGGVENF